MLILLDNSLAHCYVRIPWKAMCSITG